jgi:hypothetical protein
MTPKKKMITIHLNLNPMSYNMKLYLISPLITLECYLNTLFKIEFNIKYLYKYCLRF